MREREVQDVLLIRAFEEEDREQRLLPGERRIEALRAAREQSGCDETGLLCRRAAVLRDELTGRIPTLSRLLRLVRLRFAPAPAVVGAAVVAGLLTNALGPSREVNLLSVPVLGMLAWNLLAYLALASSALGLLSSARGLATWGPRAALARLRRWKPPARLAGPDARVVSSAVARFIDLWRHHASTLLSARVRRTLHVAAVAFAAGAIGGMYLRGLAFEYRATWESTFLDTGQVQVFLNGVLGPAAALLGIDVPDVGPLRGPGGGGDAAPWIHLYAVTAAMVVLLPRTLLALFHDRRARQIAADLPLDFDEGYYRRLLAEGRGTAVRVVVVPYSFEPDRASTDRLKSLVHDFFGARADVRVQDTTAYGEESAAVRQEDAGEAERCTVVLFNLAQPPESEVHGDFLRRLVSHVGREARTLVIVDGTTYRRRIGNPERWTERARAWQRVVGEAGRTAVVLDLDEADGIDRALDAMACALRRDTGEAPL